MTRSTGVMGDVAGGPVIAMLQSWATLNAIPIVVLGDPVLGHGDSPHDAPVMVQGSTWFTINYALQPCRFGDAASCGHTLFASQSWFRIT